MRDMHRERLTHLLANAILELWKKETGSLSSVVIEGTICITSSTGKTTVLQVADRFTGSIPEAEDEADHAFSPPEGAGRGRYHHHPGGFGVMRSLSMPHGYPEHTAPPRVDCHNQTVMAAFLDNLSPASLVSPGTEYSRSSLERRSPSGQLYPGREVNNNHTTPDASSGSVKEETSECGSSDSVSDDKHTETSTGGICAGTGYYTCAPQEMNNNTIDVVKHPLKFHKGRSPQTSPERSKRRCSRERSPPPPSDSSTPGGSDRKRSSVDQVHVHVSKSLSPPAGGSSRRSYESRGEVWEQHSPPQQHTAADAMDLTRKCSEQVNSRGIGEAGVSRKYTDDLALSPPHSYTAQVRDIIRQRVLAAQHKAVSSPSSAGDLEAEPHGAGPNLPLGEGAGKSTPKVLESLGLQRSDGEEGEEVSPQHRSRRESEGSSTAASTPEDVLRVSATSRKHALHPLLLGPLSPITSAASPPSAAGSTHSPLPSPGSGVTSSNGHLHSILQQHRLFLPLPPLSRPTLSLASSGPASAPPLFTHPGFSPLTMPHTAPGGTAPRDTSPSPTDLSLDSSGEGDTSSTGGEQRVYRCEYCTKTFLFKSKYHEHLPVHTNARPFQCHLCSRTYKYKYDLRVHLRTHMGIPTKSTVCPFCNTKFDTNKRLRVHIKDAHKDKQKVEDEEPGTSLPPTPEPGAPPNIPPPTV